jgi:hypothetical protein
MIIKLLLVVVRYFVFFPSNGVADPDPFLDPVGTETFTLDPDSGHNK